MDGEVEIEFQEDTTGRRLFYGRTQAVPRRKDYVDLPNYRVRVKDVHWRFYSGAAPFVTVLCVVR